MTGFIDGLFSLESKVALVSGASRGIGLTIAQSFSKAGATVFGVGRSPAVEQVEQILYQQCDISDQKHFSQICQDIFSKNGSLDIYVHAAGITNPNISKEIEFNSFNETLAINLIAAYSCCSVVLRYMCQQGSGSIINITSIASVLGFPNNPGYVASKGGLRMLTKALAIDMAEKNIRINNLAPGYIHTSMTEKSFRDPIKHMERQDRMIIKRWGKPQDLVGAAIFLASDASAYITGQDIFVDGGWTAKGL